MKRLLLFLVCVCLFSGCASLRNDIAHKGGLFTEYRGDYVVISESGGIIMDVWVLEDVYVESEKNSDGWRFIDSKGQPTNVGGDSKVIRIKDKAELQQYREYHIERSNLPYSAYFKRVQEGWVQPPQKLSGLNFFDRSTELAGRYHLRKRVNRFFDRSRGRSRSRRMIG